MHLSTYWFEYDLRAAELANLRITGESSTDVHAEWVEGEMIWLDLTYPTALKAVNMSRRELTRSGERLELIDMTGSLVRGSKGDDIEHLGHEPESLYLIAKSMVGVSRCF